MGDCHTDVSKAAQDESHRHSVQNEPIAIIGMGCRYPRASGVEALWQLLLDGRDAIEPYATTRFRELDEAYAKTAAGHGELATHLGGFLPEVDRFDAAFFSVSPREAAFIDPQHRLLLEVSWNALEDAGQLRDNYQGSRTGVFTGLWTTDYENYIFRNSERPEFYLLTGGGRSTACGRISFTFGFEGPSISVDTACSSSMVAIHLACQSLRQAECDMALAGGVNVILSTDFTRLFTNAGMLAKDGHCKFGDQAADGFVRSEGAGMVVLKRLSDAKADRDEIYAVIRGSAVNNDGKSSGLLVTPSRDGQRAMLLDAWRTAAISGGDLDYIEAHGTGTQVGDPIEIGAISDALTCSGATRKIPIGSLKTNIGHSESAAGIAGVIKAALVLNRGIIPRSLSHFTPNVEIAWDSSAVEVATNNLMLQPTSGGKPHLAGASSFGLTGTNAHMVLAEHCRFDDLDSSFDPLAIDRFASDGLYLLPITAFTSRALKLQFQSWRDFLRQLADSDLGRICYRAGAKRTHLGHRCALTASDVEEFRVQLDFLLADNQPASPELFVARERPCKVVFVAPGQGSQWDGMARELLVSNRAFRDCFESCDRVIFAETGWSLLDRLNGPNAGQFLTEIDFIQPALFAMSLSLAAVWRAAGVSPAAVIGHSMGEVAAACLCGALSIEDGAAVICRRSRLMRTLSGSGAMASVELPADELASWIEPFGDKISIAAENSPGTTVLSGESASVERLLEVLELKKVYCRRIRVDVASHSFMVDPILIELESSLAHIIPKSSEIPFFSTVVSSAVDGRELTAAYWVKNLRQPVKLASVVNLLASDGFNCFIELSPHPILTPALEATLHEMSSRYRSTSANSGCLQDPAPAVFSSLLRSKPALETLLQSFGKFWAQGGCLDWNYFAASNQNSTFHGVLLPDYPFERERFWPEEEPPSSERKGKHSDFRLSPLLNSRIDLADEPGSSVFSVNSDMMSLPYLADHRVGGAIVFPASAHIEAALEAGRSLAPHKALAIAGMSFLQALYLSPGEDQELQVSVRRVPGTPGNFHFSLRGRQGSGEGGWIEHSTGRIETSDESFLEKDLPGDSELSKGALFDCSDPGWGSVVPGTSEEHYRKALRSGLEYGPAFQLLDRFVRSGQNSRPRVRTWIRLNEEVRLPGYLIHPALLDSCFQAMLHLLPQISGTSPEDVYLPLSINQLRLFRTPSEIADLLAAQQLVTEATFVTVDNQAGTFSLDLQLKTEGGLLLAQIDSMTVQRVKSRSHGAFFDDLLSLSWKALPAIGQPTPGGSAGRHWLIFADLPETDSDRLWDNESNVSVNNPSGRSSGIAFLSIAAQLAERHARLAGRCTLVWLGNRFRALGGSERRLDLLGADEYEMALDDEPAIDSLLRLVSAEAGQISDVIDLWTLGSQSGSRDVLMSVLRAQSAGTKFLPALSQAISRAGWTTPPRLWLVTRGTQHVAISPPAKSSNSAGTASAKGGANNKGIPSVTGLQLAGSTVWGFGASLAREMPELHSCLIDLSCDPQQIEIDMLANMIALSQVPSHEVPELCRERVALRGELLYGARLTKIPLATRSSRRSLRLNEHYRIGIDHPGALDQLQLEAIVERDPRPGEITIVVTYTGLNFIDVTKALGIYPGLNPKDPIQMGGECSGIVVSVGQGVTRFAVGDEVLALTPSPTRVGLLASRVQVPEELAMHKPSNMTLAQAAALPIAYLTAHYALNELARIREGEWVLVHAGAGGVGLAAISIASAVGARVIATASSPEKHAFLKSWGVSHVLQSRTYDFADQVIQITGSRGADVVLNSLSGDFIPRSLDTLAPYGRFIELGKRDIYEDRRVGLKAFRHNIAYFTVDLAALIEDRPAYASLLLKQSIHAVEAGSWKTLPVKSFASSDPADAFRFLSQGRHIGKLVVEFNSKPEMPTTGAQDLGLQVLPPAPVTDRKLFRQDGTYVITGGLGGVGKVVGDWMASRGAGHLVLVSRRHAGPNEEEAMRRIRDMGAEITHQRVDLLDLEAVRQMVEAIQRSQKPLRGVMHAAAMIDDALIATMSSSRFDTAFGPKITGTWHLHETTKGLSLDHFILFSSIASICPQPGHGSYSAANSFMDAFSGYRRQLGLPASSINWAGWLGLGLANETGTSRTIEAYEAEGIGSFDREAALLVLEHALEANPVQALAARIDADQIDKAFKNIPPLFEDIAGVHGKPSSSRREAEEPTLNSFVLQLASAVSPAERIGLLEDLLRTETSRVLKLPAEKISASRPFGQMGIDSLMALELIRRVNGALNLALPATAVFNYPTLTLLSVQILKKLENEFGGAPLQPVSSTRMEIGPLLILDESPITVSTQGAETIDASEDLSDEDAMRALMGLGDSLSD